MQYFCGVSYKPHCVHSCLFPQNARRVQTWQRMRRVVVPSDGLGDDALEVVPDIPVLSSLVVLGAGPHVAVQVGILWRQ